MTSRKPGQKARPVTTRGRALVRVLRLWRLLDGRRYRPSATELGRELGVSYRTIHRDIKVLEEAYLAVPPALPQIFYGAVGQEKQANS